MKKILVADDIKVMANGLSEVLVMEGFDVKVAYDGLEAYKHIQADRPDLVITDLRMPKMDGFELVRAIRNDSSCLNIRIIVVTASASPENKEEILRLGVNLFVTKPFDDEQLVNSIKTILDSE